jgi:hypothetical protein
MIGFKGGLDAQEFACRRNAKTDVLAKAVPLANCSGANRVGCCRDGQILSRRLSRCRRTKRKVPKSERKHRGESLRRCLARQLLSRSAPSTSLAPQALETNENGTNRRVSAGKRSGPERVL